MTVFSNSRLPDVLSNGRRTGVLLGGNVIHFALVIS